MNFTKPTLYSLTRDLMDHHNLQHWDIRIGQARNCAGLCNYSRKQITVSLHLANAMPVEETRDTILHEIAHALAGSKAGHGPDWVAMCHVVGANPERCFDTSKINPDMRYRFVGYCPTHPDRTTKRNRRARMVCSCGADVVWKDTENPTAEHKPFNNTKSNSTMAKLTRELLKAGGCVSDDGVFLAPSGHTWNATDTHYLDPTSPYYTEDDYGRDRTKEGIAKILLEEVLMGTSPCGCEFCH